MNNTPDRAEFWKEFICAKCQYPAPEKLRAQFSHARFSEFCNCGCNSFKVEVPPDSGATPIAEGGNYGMVFEAQFRLPEKDKTLEILLFSGKDGNLAYVEIDCCGNTIHVPDIVEIQEAPFHIHASKKLVL